MSSFRPSVTPNRRAAAHLVGSVRRRLQKAMADRPRVTQTQIAKDLGVHRSVINRQLRGSQDMTIGRVAEIALSLGYAAEFDLIDMAPTHGQNAPAIQQQSSPFRAQQTSTTGYSNASVTKAQVPAE